MYTSFHLQKIVKNNIACTYDIRDDVCFPIVNFPFLMMTFFWLHRMVFAFLLLFIY